MPEEFVQEDIVVEQPEYVVPEGFLTLELVSSVGNLPAYKELSEEEKKAGKKEVRSCRLNFKVVDEGEFKDAWASDIMSQTLNVGKQGPSTLRRYVEGLLGRELGTVVVDGKEKPEGANLKNLTGRRIKVMVIKGPKTASGRQYADIQVKTIKSVGKPVPAPNG